MAAQVVPVGILAAYVRDLLEQDAVLADIWVEGEISNLFRAQSGHFYFSLKDTETQLKCVMFRAQAARIRTDVRPGDQAAVHGYISLYPRDGAVQLYADLIQPAGLGILALQLEQLRLKLEAEGLFDPARKRPLPAQPRAIGVVTSPDGAVWHDIQQVLRRRYPLTEVILAPTPVQGDSAPDRIVAALDAIQQLDQVEVIILARGGGSAEDLAAFNDERVARAVFAARVPIVTGVGHETDWTIVDWVADLRAPTPSAAAELCVPDVVDLAERLAVSRARLSGGMRQELETARTRLDTLRHRLTRLSPAASAAIERGRIAALRRRAAIRQQERLRFQRADLMIHTGMLRALEPRGVLGRGYAVVSETSSGRPIARVRQAPPGSTITTQFADGELTSVVRTASSNVAGH